MGHSVETRENVKNNGIKLWNHLLADTKKNSLFSYIHSLLQSLNTDYYFYFIFLFYPVVFVDLYSDIMILWAAVVLSVLLHN